MKNLFTVSISLFAVLFFFSNAFPCGMMNRGTNRGMMCQNQNMIQHSSEETSTAMSHDKVAIEKEDLVLEPSRLVEDKCSRCHSLNFIFLSRKADWSHTVHRMNDHLLSKNMTALTDNEKGIITNYLNTYFSLSY